MAQESTGFLAFFQQVGASGINENELSDRWWERAL
jgi:hypothetical protein